MKYTVVFLAGMLAGIVAHWFVSQPSSNPTVVNAREEAAEIRENLKNAFDAQTIKEELSRTGRVVREKARHTGEAIGDATADARITSTIKAKLLKESTLTALEIDVDTSGGVVTLSGTVSSHEQIAKAMSLAMDTEGVARVISVLQVPVTHTQRAPEPANTNSAP
jgi:hypothetical protein